MVFIRGVGGLKARRKRQVGDSGDVDVDALLEAHGESILRVARRYSESAADAEDAFQRAMEKLLTKAPPDRSGLAAWLSTVVRNEALMIRRGRKSFAQARFEDAADQVVDDARTPEESTIASELVGRQREALKRLKPDQLRCMLLRADGMSQNEIVGLTGFSVAKVQRSLWEGRRAFQAQVERVESGRECARIAPMLSAYADDAITESGRRDVGLHLEGCLACRAVLRDFRSAPSDIAAFFPVGTLLATRERVPSWSANALENAQAWFGERAFGLVQAIQGAEYAFAKKAVIVSAATASLVVGGVGVERIAGPADDGGPSAIYRSADLPSPMASPPVGSPPADDGRIRGDQSETPAAAASPSTVAAADLLDTSDAVEESSGHEKRTVEQEPPSGLPGDFGDGQPVSESTGEADRQSGAPSDGELLGAGE